MSEQTDGTKKMIESYFRNELWDGGLIHWQIRLLTDIIEELVKELRKAREEK